MPQAAPFWLCHECGAQMRPLEVNGVPQCASCTSEFIEILDEEINPDPMHELPHPPTRPGEYNHLPPPPIPPRPGSGAPGDEAGGAGAGGFLSTLLDSVFGRLDDPHNTNLPRGDPPPRPPRPDTDTDMDEDLPWWAPPRPPGMAANPNAPRTRTYNWGNASFTVTTGSTNDLFGNPSGRQQGNPWVGGLAGAPGDPNAGLDSYFHGFGAPPNATRAAGGRRMGPDGRMAPEDASGALFLQALLDMLAEDTGRPGLFPSGRFGDYVMTEDGYNDILERLMQAAGPQGPLPATSAVIEGLPRCTFDPQSLEQSQFKDCPVCMEDFAVDDKYIKLPCKHIFHPDCLVPWLQSNGSCPTCRFSLVPDPSNAPGRAQAGTGVQAGQAESSTSAAQADANANRGALGGVQDFLTNTIANTLNRLWGQSGTAGGESGSATPDVDGPPTTTDAQFAAAAANLQRAADAQAGPGGRPADPDPDAWPPADSDYRPGVFPGHHPSVPDSPPRHFVRRASTLSNSYVPSPSLSPRPSPTEAETRARGAQTNPVDAYLADSDPEFEHSDPNRTAGTRGEGREQGYVGRAPRDPVDAYLANSDPDSDLEAYISGLDPAEGTLADLDPPDVPVATRPRGYSPGVISGIPLPSLSSAIPADYRARHAQREREQRERDERERAAGGHPYWDDDVD